MKTIEVPITDIEIKEVQVLRLEPTDALVLRVPHPLSMAATKRLREALEGWSLAAFGREVRCLVLEDGASAEILREALPEEATL